MAGISIRSWFDGVVRRREVGFPRLPHPVGARVVKCKGCNAETEPHQHDTYDCAANLRAQLAAMTQKALDNAFRAQALDDKLRAAEREAMFRAANICRTYAHTDLSHSQMRRQIAYACERRILEAAREITVDAVNERMENLSQEQSDGQRSPQPGARPS